MTQTLASCLSAVLYYSLLGPSGANTRFARQSQVMYIHLQLPASSSCKITSSTKEFLRQSLAVGLALQMLGLMSLGTSAITGATTKARVTATAAIAWAKLTFGATGLAALARTDTVDLRDMVACIL
eukprot:CAMPEP_0119106358 /NCGR_PEP_ID=MMETSP1180-20130426/4066_1 /TAXON_ID=3052 ORGANISM="Chlamydomonas cf sp, Strain CCMP681" /NCGR_SAMPLE_ID=MMETSP1180 /ASSEMBLY_ACC=CAM_ASM_000741 /LENGTH=125 /DNA_ID=CAMNT_0007091675 /DNA_START=183 /DNA_END=559 /DNA_ORIENTATION=-